MKQVKQEMVRIESVQCSDGSYVHNVGLFNTEGVIVAEIGARDLRRAAEIARAINAGATWIE